MRFSRTGERQWFAGLEPVFAGHLAGLPDEDRALLGAASVQGDKFTGEVAARVLGWDEEAALQRLSGPLRTRASARWASRPSWTPAR